LGFSTRLREQHGDVDAQGYGKPLDVIQRNVPLFPLDRTDVGPVKVSEVSQRLLRDALLLPKPPEV
jgi:hypothetical protein